MARTRISRCSSRPRRHRDGQRGFTLLELLLVLTILGLSLAVLSPMLGAGSRGLGLERGGLELASALRQTRREAVTTVSERVLLMDLSSGTYRTDSGSLQRDFPANSDITVEAAGSEQLEESLLGIRFFPTGASTGGSILVKQADRSLSVTVDWLTGRVAIHGPE